MIKSIILTCYLILCVFGVNAKEPKSFEISRTVVTPIKDTHSGKQYELYIKLPKGYSDNKETTYPVIYFTDAVWHIEILSASTEFILEDVILVGVSWQKDIDESLKQEYGEHFSRFGDYSFWTKSNPKHPKIKFGNADNHIAFIRNDVFKHVESTYRTDTSNRTYFGYSAGGSFGAYTLVTQPDTFKNYILGSPGVDLLIEGEFKVELKSEQLDANVLITRGDLETKQEQHNEAFVAELAKRSKVKTSIRQEVIPGNHQTAFPMTGVRSVIWLANLQKEEVTDED